MLFLKLLFLITFVLLSKAGIASQSIESDRFVGPAIEYKIPPQILQAISFLETRWSVIDNYKLKSCNGIPKSYGVMGLKNDSFFGHQVDLASRIMQKSTKEIVEDQDLNIRASAALLRRIAETRRFVLPGLAMNLDQSEAWKYVLSEYSGIPDKEGANKFAQKILKLIRTGLNENRFQIYSFPVPEDLHLQSSLSIEFGHSAEGKADYPGAFWNASENYESASKRKILAIVIHVTEGSYEGAISWLKKSVSRASAHYIIQSHDGEITQLVREKNTAWHARCWNDYTIGIEHEGFIDDAAYYTDALYESSSSLVQYLLKKYQLTPQHVTVVGHNFWEDPEYRKSPLGKAAGICNDHIDPGTYWDWPRYFNEISSPKNLINALLPLNHY